MTAYTYDPNGPNLTKHDAATATVSNSTSFTGKDRSVPNTPSKPKRTVRRRNEDKENEDPNTSDDEEEDDVYDNPDLLDVEMADVSSRTPNRPRHVPLDPMSPNDPCLRIVKQFVREDVTYYYLPDGRSVSAMEHGRLLNIATTNKLLKQMGVTKESCSVLKDVAGTHRRRGPPETFTMPPPREMPDRAAKRATNVENGKR